MVKPGPSSQQLSPSSSGFSPTNTQRLASSEAATLPWPGFSNPPFFTSLPLLWGTEVLSFSWTFHTPLKVISVTWSSVMRSSRPELGSVKGFKQNEKWCMHIQKTRKPPGKNTKVLHCQGNPNPKKNKLKEKKKKKKKTSQWRVWNIYGLVG